MTSIDLHVELVLFGSRWRAIVTAPVEGIDELIMGRVTHDKPDRAVKGAIVQATADVVHELTRTKEAVMTPDLPERLRTMARTNAALAVWEAALLTEAAERLEQLSGAPGPCEPVTREEGTG